MARENRDDERTDEPQVTTDREMIQGWVGEHDATPVRYAGVEGESNQLRIVPENEVEQSHERMEWAEFFSALESSESVVVFRGADAASGERFEIAGRDDVVGRAPLENEEAEAALSESETVSGAADRGDTVAETGAETETADRGGTVTGTGTETTEAAAGTDPDARRIPAADDEGKRVIDTDGRELGMVTAVEGDTLHVDPEPSLADRIRAALNWGEPDDDAYPVPSDRIVRITDDVVELSVPE